jgi:hypothetical protein
VLVIGEAGSGKSAILAALARACQQPEVDRSSVLIRANEHWRRGATPPTQRWHEIASRGQVLLLIDGLDEVAMEHRFQAAAEIATLQRDSPAMQVFVASRPVSELSLLREFEALTVAPLTSIQVVLWLKRAIEGSAITQSAAPAELEDFVCHMTERHALRASFRNPLFLDSAWTLFSRNRVTPFAEAELLGEFARRLLDERDRERNLIRIREPWASPRSLALLLGELCFRLIESRKEEFETRDAERWLETRLREVPCDRLLPLLSLQSGVLNEAAPGHWRVSQHYLRHYFAAAHAVESPESTWGCLNDWQVRDDVRDVLRLACGISSDATPLLEVVLDAPDALEPARCALLAEILAQPVVALPEIVAASCDAVVGWLDSALQHWRLESELTPGRQRIELEPLWKLRASGAGRLEAAGPRILGAIHRARSGPARQLLLERLDKARSPVLPAFAESIHVDGHLHLQYESEDGESSLLAAVVAPELG